MDKFQLKNLILETVYSLLEEFSELGEGDNVITREDGSGVVALSKHPYYSVTLDNTGVTKSYHFNQLKPKEKDFGKYDINESESEDIVQLYGILTTNTKKQHLGSLLSDIRSILGVTIVRNDDIFDNKEYNNENYKTQLSIKIDPYPYKTKNIGYNEMIKYIIHEILKMDSVKGFIKKEQLPTEKPKLITKTIPVKSIDDLKEIKFKIK